MTLRIIRPAFANAEAVFPKLVSSDFAPAFDPTDGTLWNVATAYAVGQRVYVLGTTNKVYEALTANTGKAPATSKTDWEEVGYTNTYRMFDTVNSSLSKASGPANKVVVFDPGRINALYLGNMSGITSVDVLIKNGATTVYSKSFSLVSGNVSNWYQYWFEPVVLKDALAIFDLPAYGAARVTLTFHGSGAMSLGTVQCGLTAQVGEVQWEPSFRFLDYSSYKSDKWGNVILTSRLPGRTISAKVFVKRTDISFDQTNRTIEGVIGKIVVFSFNGDKYGSLNALGFINDFDHVLPNSAGSYFNIKVQGLV